MTLFISVLLLLSTKFQSFERLIDKLTGKNSVFEIGIFFLLLMISTFAMLISFSNQSEKTFTKARKHFIAFIALCFYFIAMQEVRWAQLLVGKNSANASDAFNSIIGLNFVVGDNQINIALRLIILFSFILLPLLIYYHPAIIRNNTSIRNKATIYLPSMHCMLMFCFACSLQTLINPLTKYDHFILLSVFILIFGLILLKDELRSFSVMAHWCLVGGSWLLYWAYSENIPLRADYYHLWKIAAVYAFFLLALQLDHDFKRKGT